MNLWKIFNIQFWSGDGNKDIFLYTLNLKMNICGWNLQYIVLHGSGMNAIELKASHVTS